LPPPLPPRRNSTAVPALFHLKTTATQPSAMTSRYARPSSPRGRFSNPARSSTGTFDPYYDSTYYGRPSSPRTSGERIGGSLYSTHTYAPSSSSSSRSSTYKYDSYSGRPRRSTLTESDDRSSWSNIPPPALPVRPHVHHDRPSSPLSRTWDNRADTYVTYPPTRREHKRIYSVDDNSHSTKLVAEKDILESRRRDLDDRGYSITSGGRSYHLHKPTTRTSDVGDDGFSYTDPAGMFRDTEPAWRRPRSGSVERGSRPTSMIAERTPRSSNRELGPPPSTRGFDKINNNINRSGSHHRGRSPSLERGRDVSKYDNYPEPHPPRPASTLYHAPAVNQEPRRDAYRNDYGRPDRDVENRRYTPADQFDPDVAKRGFGIASPIIAQAPEQPYQPHWNMQEPPRARPAEHANQYYAADRAEVRMPEPRPREREGSSTYEERPRDRDRDRDRRESGHVQPQSAIPAVAGAVAGAVGGALLKSRNKDRDSERDYDRDRELEKEREREREQRREWDERDRRDRVSDDRREERRSRNLDDRRDRPLEDRRDRAPEDRRERVSEERIPPPASGYVSTHDVSRKHRDRRSEDDERERRARKAPSSEGSGDERPRHYVERDAAKESDHRKDTAPILDPDEDYRRRIQLEAERNGRGRDPGESDRDKERQRRREERDKSRDRVEEVRPRAPPSDISAETPRSRHDDHASHILDTNIVQEPDSMLSATQEQSSRSVQIVTPPKEPPPQPKGILRKPTEKFPEEPEPIREGVAPHKSQLKGKDIPQNARWTKIDRRLVNPEALEEAKERFEERLDCVIVLRVLTKQEIQKLADRTKEIRASREDEYDRDDHRDRERRSRRYRDEDDRDRRRDYDDDDDIGRDRERDRD
ncbi:hypothetical protein DM02DRAFT_476630, partial [Periconia macrospinosa]